MSMNMGGQQRTAMMPCGKVVKADPRTVKVRILIHQKVCETCAGVVYVSSPFLPNENDRANITITRNGNITKATHKEIKTICDGQILPPLLVKANTTEKSLTVLKEVKEVKEMTKKK